MITGPTGPIGPTGIKGPPLGARSLWLLLPAAVIVLGLVLALGGCAGRPPQPVALIQPQDRQADCQALLIEAQANNAQIASLGGDQGGKVAQNVAMGVAGVFIPVLWFGMDFQGTAGKEIAALQSRQQYLAVLAEQKHCGAE